MNTYVVIAAAGLFTGKAAQIAALAIVTIALGAFGVVAMRLRKGVVNTLDEATESVVNKFVIPSDNSSSSVSSRSGDTSNTYNSMMRNVQTGANTIASGAVAGKQMSNLLNGGGAAGPDGQNGSMMGKVFGTGSGQEHETVASGTGDTTVNQQNGGAEVNSTKTAANSSLAQNSNAATTNSDSYDNGVNSSSKSVDSNTDNLSNVDSNARSTMNGVATGGEYMTSDYMRDQSTKDVRERKDGKDLMQYDSLAAASGTSTKEVKADGAAAHANVHTSANASSDAVNVKGVRADSAAPGAAGAAGKGADAVANANSDVSADASSNVKGVAAMNGQNGAAGYGEAGKNGNVGKGGQGGAAGHGANAHGGSATANSEAQNVRGIHASSDVGRSQAQAQANAQGAAGHGQMNMNVAGGESQQARNVRVSATATGGVGGAGTGIGGTGTAGMSGQFGRGGQSGGQSTMTMRDRAARAQAGGMPPGMYARQGAPGQGGAGGAAGMSARGGAGGAGGAGSYRYGMTRAGSGAGTSYVPGGNRAGVPNRSQRRHPGSETPQNPVAGRSYDPSVETGSRGVGPTGMVSNVPAGAAGHYQPRTTNTSGGTYRNKNV